MIFLDLDPRTTPHLGTSFFWGGGVKTTLRIVAAVCVFGPGSCRTFFLYMDPVIHGGGPGSQLRVPPVAPPIWPLAGEDLAVFTWHVRVLTISQKEVRHR